MRQKRRPRVVVDTGVLISSFIFGGVPKKILLHLSEKTQPFVSHDILSEYREVPLELEAEDKITHEQLKILLAGISAFIMHAKIAHVRKSISICRDKADNVILECCLAAKADYLITGDRDLLEIDKHSLSSIGLKKLKILSPRSYLSKFM